MNMRFKVGGHSMLSFVAGLWVNHVVSLFLTVVIMGIMTIILKEGAKLPSVIITLYLYLLLSYNEGWNRGSTNNRRFEKKPVYYWLRGFSAGLLASVPGTILAGILLYDYIRAGTIKDSIISLLYRLLYLPFTYMFDYLDKIPALYFLPILVMCVSCGTGYILGLKQFALRQVLVYEIKRDNHDS